MFSRRELPKNFTFSKVTESSHVHKISDTFPTKNGNTAGENNIFPTIQHDLLHYTTLNHDEKQKLASLLLNDKAFLYKSQALTTINVLKHKIRIPDDPPVWPFKKVKI